MGYGVGVKGYRVWCEKLKRITTYWNVVFDENVVLFSSVEKPVSNDEDTPEFPTTYKRGFNLPILRKKMMMMMINKRGLLLCPLQ